MDRCSIQQAKARFQRLINTPTIGDTTVFYQPHTFPETKCVYQSDTFSVALSVHLTRLFLSL